MYCNFLKKVLVFQHSLLVSVADFGLFLEVCKEFLVDWSWYTCTDGSAVDFDDCAEFCCSSRDDDLVCGVEVEESKFADFDFDAELFCDA